MKKIIISASLAAVAAFFTGCATPFPVGSIVTDVKLPVLATSTTISEDSKKGEASCESYFGLFATGDASIEEAAKDGGITKITHIDWKAKNILGVYGEYIVTVYGE